MNMGFREIITQFLIMNHERIHKCMFLSFGSLLKTTTTSFCLFQFPQKIKHLYFTNSASCQFKPVLKRDNRQCTTMNCVCCHRLETMALDTKFSYVTVHRSQQD